MNHEIVSKGVRALGIFGGTFDPVHVAHLLLAETAREELALDRVVFMPALIPPHKRDGRTIASPEHRLAMLEIATADNPGFFVSDRELIRPEVSYTVDTLTDILKDYPSLRLTLLFGGDSLRDFHTWHNPAGIASMARIAVLSRPGVTLPSEALTGVGYRRIDGPIMQISSTDIRSRVAQGQSIRYHVPHGVADYIEQHGLYR